ncbi:MULTISPECIES: O-antigen ligase family protein [Hwangdonia]|uniref:O-antigen ligase family protein n=1 Tax=Hwangdonia seohaensis TaxID=1240727 RepID=A0ABW3R8P9_9FLAO|nr:O-antigen ligase family protein [Hwangdonia seohaensis]
MKIPNYVLKASKIFLYLLALLPLLSLPLVSIAIMLFVFFSIISFRLTNQEKNTMVKKEWFLFFLFTTPFLFYLIALIWTEDLSLGIKLIEKNLSFLVIPFTVFILKPFKSHLQIKNFIKTYIISCSISVIFTILYILINLKSIYNQQNTYFINIKLRETIELTPIIGEHAIYFSLILGIGLLLLFYNRFKNRRLNIFLFLMLTIGIVIASSRGVIIAILIVGVLLAYQEIKNKRKLVIIIVLSISGFAVLAYVSPIKKRVIEIVNTKYIYPKGDYYNSFNLRMAIYNCSLSLINESAIIGFAPADLQQKLNECYKKFDTSAFQKTNYNTHNQYLDYILSFGAIGFILILFSFAYFLKIAIVTQNNEYFNFLILMYIAFLTENILVRNTGIVLFVMFNCLFAYSTLLKNFNLNIKQ